VTVAPGSAAPAPPPRVYTWSGCYINAGVGYGMWKLDHYGENLAPLTQLTSTVSSSGEPWIGTIGAGCDYQVGSRWLIGAFGDYSLMSNIYGGSFQEPYWDSVGNETEQRAWAVGGRIGYLVTPKLLTYISAGYTQGRFGQINLSPVAPTACGAVGPCFIPAHTDGGWFIGSGTEFALWDIIPVPGLFLRLDYRYAAYDGVDLPIVTSTAHAEGRTDRYRRAGLALQRRRASIRISLRGRCTRDGRARRCGSPPPTAAPSFINTTSSFPCLVLHQRWRRLRHVGARPLHV
jgi:outer membrane immunogenic protein